MPLVGFLRGLKFKERRLTGANSAHDNHVEFFLARRAKKCASARVPLLL